MWRLIWYMQGYCVIRLTGASVQWALGRLSDARVAFLKPVRVDDFTLEMRVLEKSLPAAQRAAQRAMCDMEVISRCGFWKSFGRILRRKAFALMLLFCAGAAVIVPKFVFFYEVCGNARVEDEKILRALESLGVGFGTYGPSIHPQELKNKMLLLIPELQWLTIQQSGMRAKIVVRERPQVEKTEPRRAPMDVVAAKDGVITSVSALEGNCLCAPGQAVKRGEVLISAYTDLEFTTRVSSALGEVYAQTLSRKTLVMPDTMLKKQLTRRTGRRIYLLAGEKRWIIFSNSGNVGGKCDKITKKNMLTLPGGLQLPLGIEITEYQEYDTILVPRPAQAAKAVLSDQCSQSVRQDMIAGKILSQDETLMRSGGVYELTAAVRCEEMIARMVRTSITGAKEESS